LGKYLLLIFVIVAAWWLAKGFRRSGKAGDAPAAAPEQMVSCGHCGVYLPQSEAVREGDRYFCCNEHRRLAS
jgi:uncharacterized protein